MEVYTIGSIKHDTTVIKGIENSSYNNQLSQLLLAGSGHVDASFVGVDKIAPQMNFTTSAIKTALAALGGINGIAIAASNYLFFLQKTVTGALRAGVTSHIKGTAVAGIVIPDTLRLPDTGHATMAYRVIFISADGSTAPVAFVINASLDAGDGGADEAYKLGAVSINGSPLAGVNEVTINFGLSEWLTGGSGLVYPIHVAISSRRPSIEMKSYDIATAVGWGIAGAAQGASDSTIQIDDVTEGSIRGSSPITFTLDEGMVRFSTIDGQENERASASVIYTPTHDGTAAIMAISGLV